MIILSILSNISHLLKLILWAQICSILENNSFTLENIYIADVIWSFLYLSIRPSKFILLFKFPIPSLIFSSSCLIYYWNDNIEISNHYRIACLSIQFCQVLLHIIWEYVIGCVYDGYIFLHKGLFYQYIMSICLL